MSEQAPTYDAQPRRWRCEKCSSVLAVYTPGVNHWAATEKATEITWGTHNVSVICSECDKINVTIR